MPNEPVSTQQVLGYQIPEDTTTARAHEKPVPETFCREGPEPKEQNGMPLDPMAGKYHRDNAARTQEHLLATARALSR